MLSKPLQYVFYLFISDGNFPSIWKKSFIIISTHIYKFGDKSNVENYRQISKLSIIPQ